MVSLYTTCPASHDVTATGFRGRIVDVARWTEAAGYRGLLIHTDNTLIDPWAVAQALIARTASLVPLVTVQPVYAHPFTVARMVSTIWFMYGRPVDLNLVTGGSAVHLRALGDVLEPEERFARLGEYATVVRRLLGDRTPVTHIGRFYRLHRAAVQPSLPPRMAPRLLVSGSSPACVGVQRALGAVRMGYPPDLTRPESVTANLGGTGIRVGVIARDTRTEAWRTAHRRFPGELSTSDSPYWTYPFHAHRTFCPYLVGSYAEVGDLLARYVGQGLDTVVLDVPVEEDDLHHADLALRRASLAAA
jgi:alkanesulfonate monooxygenase